MQTEAETAVVVTMPAPNLGKRVEQFIKLRDLIKEREKIQKEELKPLKDTLEQLSEYLLAHLNQLGADNLSSPSGTVYRTERKSASLADAEAFMQYVIENSAWDLLVRKANETAVEDYIKEHQAPPPGVNFNRQFTVGVRRK